MTRKLFSLVLTLLILFPATGSAQLGSTQEKAANPPTAEIEYRVIVASESGASESRQEKIDPRLSDLEGELKRLFRFNRYRLVKVQKDQIKLGQTKRTTVAGNLSLTTEWKSYSQKRLTLGLRLDRLKKGSLRGGTKLIGTTITMRPGAIFLLGGARYEEGYVILAIKVLRVAPVGRSSQ